MEGVVITGQEWQRAQRAVRALRMSGGAWETTGKRPLPAPSLPRPHARESVPGPTLLRNPHRHREMGSRAGPQQRRLLWPAIPGTEAPLCPVLSSCPTLRLCLQEESSEGADGGVQGSVRWEAAFLCPGREGGKENPSCYWDRHSSLSHCIRDFKSFML